MNKDLPKGWTSVELEHHVYIAGRIGWRGLKRSEYTPAGPRFLAVKNILPTGQIDFEDTEHLSQERYDESPEIQLRPKDILLTKDGTIGKVGMVDALPGPTTVNSSILVVRPSDDLLMDRYLFFYLRGPQFQEIARERITGSAIPHLFQKDIKRLRAFVPPLPEQRRIVAKLEKLLAKVDVCQQRLAKIPILLKRFRQSVLAAASSGKLTAVWRDENPKGEPAAAILQRIALQSRKALSRCDAAELSYAIPPSWDCAQAQDLCHPPTIITYGVLKPVWVSHGIPTVRVQDMQKGRIALDDIGRCCPERAKKFSKTTLVAGDLLIAKDGATLGKTAFVPPELAGGNITQHVLRFAITRLVDRVFVRLIIDSPHAQQWMRAETKGVALPGVNVGDFRKMPIPIPPLPEQHEIVRRVENLFALADQIETRYTKAQQHVDKITASLLAKAFRGELVPQDPNDEPAEKLLERIRTHRDI